MRICICPSLTRCNSVSLSSTINHAISRMRTACALHSNALLSAAVVEHTLSSPAQEGKVFPTKIEKIVQDIAQLTLLETSQLNELLKVHAIVHFCLCICLLQVHSYHQLHSVCFRHYSITGYLCGPENDAFC